MTGLGVIFLEIDDRTAREKVVDALLMENAKARRMTARDNWGRENQDWVEAHEYINVLLDLLEA